MLLQFDLKHIHKVNFYPSDNNFTQALLVLLVTNMISACLAAFGIVASRSIFFSFKSFLSVLHCKIFKKKKTKTEDIIRKSPKKWKVATPKSFKLYKNSIDQENIIRTI